MNSYNQVKSTSNLCLAGRAAHCQSNQRPSYHRNGGSHSTSNERRNHQCAQSSGKIYLSKSGAGQINASIKTKSSIRSAVFGESQVLEEPVDSNEADTVVSTPIVNIKAAACRFNNA